MDVIAYDAVEIKSIDADINIPNIEAIADLYVNLE